MTTELDNTQDVIDSRDVIARIEELQELADAVTEAREAFDNLVDPDGPEIECAEAAIEAAREAFDEDAQQELATLKALAEEASGYAADWAYGETLIRDSYFRDYCIELCEDIGAVPKDFPHYIEIDWDATARNIQVDYTSVDFDGVTYWVR